MTRGWYGKANGGDNLARTERGIIGALIKIPGGYLSLPAFPNHLVAGTQAHHNGRHIVARIAVRHIAAERTHVTHLRIGDQKARLPQEWQLRLKQFGSNELMLHSHGTDDDIGAVGPA